MQDKPNIGTAIPKRRYQVGDYSAAVLGEVESSDPRQYRYILAMVPMGQRNPTLYITCEVTPPRDSAQGGYRLRLITEAMSEVMDTADRWGDLDSFAEQALKLASQALGLQREQVVRLL
jgi:hypothetical protein